MVEIFIGLFIALSLFFIGSMTQAWKKLVSVITKAFCKIFSLAEIQIKKDKDLNLRKEFKEKHPEIKAIKKGTIGMKKKRSVNIFALIIVIIFLGLIITNLGVISNNIITNNLTLLLNKIHINIGPEDVNTGFTAFTFAILSFGLSKLINDWKITKQLRKEKRIKRLKDKAITNMSSKELVEAAQKKDKEIIDKVSKEK